MEININSIIKNPLFDPEFYCSSVARSGLNNIGEVTWQRAQNSAYNFVNEDNKQAFIDYFLGFGAWEESELQNTNWINALFIQEISSQLNELGIGLEHNVNDRIEILSDFESDQIICNMFYGVDNNFYFYLE